MQNSDFIGCIKWKLDSNEYMINPNKSLTKIAYENVTLPENGYYFNSKHELFVCVPPEYQPPFYYIDLMYVCEWLLSTIFLIVSVVIHYVKSYSAVNRSLVCHQLSLIVFYLSGVVYILAQSDFLPWFSFIRYFGAYFGRAAFCWLTVINFDKWRSLRPENITKVTTSTKKFCFESLFAWGVPAILIGTTSTLKFLGIRYNSDYMILHQNNIQVIFLYGSTGIIFAINIILFLLTVRNLRAYVKSVSWVNRKRYDELAVVYLKLMIVTGVNAILLAFEWAFVVQAPVSLWTIVDSLYALQGFFIFLVYHCKLSTLRKFRKRLYGCVSCSEQKSACNVI